MKKLIIILAAIFVLIAGAATGVAIYSNQPKVVARNAVLGAISNFIEREEIEPFANMLDGGSLELDANIDLGIFAIDPFSASGKLYFSDDALMIKDFSAKTGDIDISGEAYFSSELSYVTSADILGGSYGAVRGEMSDTFRSNSFWRNKLLTAEEVEHLDSLLGAYDAGADGKLERDLEKYTKKYSKILIKAFEEEARYKVETEKVKIGGERVKVRVVSVSIDEEGMYEIAKTLCNELKNDKELRKAVSDYSGDNISAYDEMLVAFEARINDYAPTPDYKYVVKIMTPKLSSRLLRLEISKKYEDENYPVLELDVGKKGIKKTDRISFIANGETVEYRITENSSKEYKAKVSLSYDGEAETILKISIDKKDDTFKLSSSLYDFEISGGLVKKGRVLTVAPDFIRLGDVSVRDLDITFVIKEKDKMPKSLKKDEVRTVFEIPSNKLKNILYRFGIEVEDGSEVEGPGGSGEGFLGDDDEIE